MLVEKLTVAAILLAVHVYLPLWSALATEMVKRLVLSDIRFVLI